MSPGQVIVLYACGFVGLAFSRRAGIEAISAYGDGKTLGAIVLGLLALGQFIATLALWFAILTHMN